MGRISRGWALAQQSWSVLKNDLSLAWFPVLSIIVSALGAAAIWVPTLMARGALNMQEIDQLSQGADQHDPVMYAAGAATAYVSTFVTIFFNVALAACAVRSMRGEDTKVSEGIKAALNRIWPILGWSVLTTTVGLVLQVLERRAPFLGRIAARILGAAWAIAAFFVVPVIAFEGAGPVRSLQRSASVVKARWGEGATGAATISVVTFLISLLVIAAAAVCAFLLFAANLVLVGYAVIAIGVLAVLVISILSSALSQIFRVAVYEYAAGGQTPGGFDQRSLQSAFAGR